MATLLELLKANGATETDLEAMKPLLSNQKFASAIESEITAKGEWERKAAEASGKLSEFESQRNQFEVQAKEANDKVQKYDDWYNNQVTPALSKVQQGAVQEAARAAAAEAKLAKAKELYGFELPDDLPTVVTTPGTIPVSPVATATPPVATRSDLPDMSKYVTADQINQQADMVGQAIAQTQQLAWEHQQLFGNTKPIDYMDLRSKAVAEKRPLKEIWEREMNVTARRAELSAAAETERKAKYDAELAAARKEGFIEGASQSINPMTREPVASRFGISFTKRDSEGSKPWDSVSSRSQDRLTKVVSTLAKQGAA